MRVRNNPGGSQADLLPKCAALVCALFCCLNPWSLGAQDNQIRLTIVDDQDRPLPAARLDVEYLVLGESEPRTPSGISDSAGQARFDLPDSAVVSLTTICRASQKAGRMVRRFGNFDPDD